MTNLAAWPPRRAPLQIRTMAYGSGAGCDAVALDIDPMGALAGSVYPFREGTRVRLHWSGGVASGAESASRPDAGEALAMAFDVGTGADTVQGHMTRVFGIGQIPPCKGIGIVPVTPVTKPKACDPRDAD